MSTDPRVDASIAKAPPFARPILEKVRERVHAMVPTIEESIKWSRAAYLVDGKLILMTAAFKEHVRVSFWRGQEMRAHQSNADSMSDLGEIHSIDELPSDSEFDRLIHSATELARSAPVPRQARAPSKPLPGLHPEFAAALAKAAQARSTFESFPPSCRRDYIEWIGEAKLDVTRQKRIATAVEWLGEGKRRTWKYEKC